MTTIEFPSKGSTYCHRRYGVYRYGVYPRTSVLAGQESRTFVTDFSTLEEAKAAFPDAEVVEGSRYAPPNLDHLPDENDF